MSYGLVLWSKWNKYIYSHLREKKKTVQEGTLKVSILRITKMTLDEVLEYPVWG